SPTFSPSIGLASLHKVSRFYLVSPFVSQLGHHLPSSLRAERCASAAPGSRSRAEAGGRRLQAVGRRGCCEETAALACLWLRLRTAVAHWPGAGMLVVQMSRCSFHWPWWRFHTTTYLPVSSTLPPSPTRVYFPTSYAVLPCPSTSSVVTIAP